MKKILIFLIVSGALTFINLNVFATSIYGTPGYNYFDNLTLDVAIDELNGFSLREIFEDGNKFNYILNDGTLTEYDYEYVGGFIGGYFGLFANTSLNSNAEHYLSFDILTLSPIDLLWVSYNNYQVFLNYDNGATIFQKYQVRWLNTDDDLFGPYIYDSTPTGNNALLLRNALLLDLEYYGIESLTNGQIDYFYSLFQLLRAGINPQTLYDIGYIHGFNAGNDFGYDNGYDDGIIQGEINGYDIGFNEGMDYAATNNITLLSVFQMIIGVVMSMLGFIINIQLFGISIASVLGTLAIGIAIIWTLKLIRG